VCRTQKTKFTTASPPAFPKPRELDAAAFETTGVDVGSPFFLMGGNRG